MAGLVPAIHVVWRVKRSQASGKSEKLCVCKPLPSAMLVSDPSVARRGVDGRDKPGHDGWSSRRDRQRPQPTATL